MVKLKIPQEEVNILWSDDPDVEVGKKKKKDEIAVVPSECQLLIQLEKNKRGGKQVTVIKGFPYNNTSYLKGLSKKLKKNCGTGGSVKGEGIEIQGDYRSKVEELLKKEGFSVKVS